MYESGLLVLAELGLSLYPQFIKLVNINLESQVVIRFITYAIIGVGGCIISSTSINSGFLDYSIMEYIVLGLVNIFHVIASYSTFQIFSSGTSYTLFYTQPIFNLLGRMLLYNERIPIVKFIYIIIALAGVHILTSNQSNNTFLESKSHQPHQSNQLKSNSSESNLDILSSISSTSSTSSIFSTSSISDYDYYVTIGLFSGLSAAITESIMYLLVKGKYNPSTFQNLTRFYLFGGIISIGIIAYSYSTSNNNIEQFNNQSNQSNQSNKVIEENKIENSFFDLFSKQRLDISMSWQQLISAVAFNGIIGFGGYYLLYYLIPKTGTVLFNSLIFLGIIFSYMWGYLLSKESIIPENILGSSLIIIAIFMINS